MTQRDERIRLALLAVVAVAVLAVLPPLDFLFFMNAARAWLAGESRLYDGGAEGFFYPPWALLLMLPLLPLPDQLGQAVFNLCSLVAMGYGVTSLTGQRLGRAGALAVAMPPTASLLLLGQWDGLILGGVGLAWQGLRQRRPWLLGLGLLLLSTKPTHVLVVLLLLLVGLRGWRPGELARAAAPTTAIMALSLPVFGADWPLRYLAFVRDSPPNVFNIALPALLGVPAALVGVVLVAALAWVVWPGPVEGRHLALGLLTGLLASAYVGAYHYVLSAPALAVVLARRPWLGLALWLLAAAGMATFVSFRDELVLPAYLVCLYLALLAQLAVARSPRPA